MVEVRTYTLPPTPLIPNSPHVLIHYPGLLLAQIEDPAFKPSDLYDLYASNGWESQWVARYGLTQPSHYHSQAHDMTVIAGEGATIRFGVADTPSDEEEHTHGKGHEDGGIWLEAKKGDVFILPAGLAHKTYDPKPQPPGFLFLQCKDENGKVIREPERARKFFEGIELEEHFMMMGSYPKENDWDFAVGGEHRGRERVVWNVPKPARDPVLGASEEGLMGLWKDRPTVSKL
ncbi:hypothetical protein K458DRAFT_428231 [Lentithecium fluviatile CBS 122367]|uniref:Uncharacterized protein n=1 Tax=Lentithecium fluviatile CBS 122367 TaxID=1168545 RepID=A0A6G1JE07_9PLEO|nr:hypothetical protein K458DRAFT_428231 [Lentithecium fluviatile CBS 122367]